MDFEKDRVNEASLQMRRNEPGKDGVRACQSVETGSM